MKLDNNPRYAIGVDIGGTNIKAAVCSDRGSINHELSVETDVSGGPKKVVQQVHEIISSFLAKKYVKERALGIGIGAPGSIDHARGRVIQPPNLPGWDSVPIVDLIESKFSLKARLENDANAAALGEAHFGAGVGIKNFICVTIGTGIGSGLISDGKILHGEKGFAGELGHTTIDYNGPKCNCGSRGCVEAYIGNNYLIERTLEELREYPSSILFTRVFRKKSELTPKEISRAANQGDMFARQVLYTAGERLGIALANAANLLDVTTFVIGGGVAGVGKPLFEGINAAMKNYTLKSIRKRLKIIPAQLGNSAGMLGAAALWF